MTGAGPADTAPPSRYYPPFVTLLDWVRTEPPPGAGESLDAVEAWLLGPALAIDGLLELIDAFAWRLAGAGWPLDRATVHVGTLHPELYGYGWKWERRDGMTDEFKVGDAVLNSDNYRLNPIFGAIEHGARFRHRFGDGPPPSPLLEELAPLGFTDYACMPLNTAGRYHNVMTVASCRPGGFTDANLAELDRLARLFTLHIERHIPTRIAINTLESYLGQAAGRQVLEGAIKRGEGRPIRSVIWVSDLRGFTALSDRLAPAAMIQVLNAYFERLVAAIQAQGGEVLKFIGDGLLAVFPINAHRTEQAAAQAALAGAAAAVGALDTLNADPESLPGIAGWRPLKTGIALHYGDVVFGNIGAADRLDFTVIGAAVNTAARVEGLTKALGQPVLLTAPVASLLDRGQVTPLGARSLRGLAQPIALFAPA